MSAKFSLGKLVATPGALAALTAAGQSPTGLLARHASGDWGDVSTGDREANDRALIDGDRLLSSYRLPTGEKLWVITEAVGDDGLRASTCLLLPSEY